MTPDRSDQDDSPADDPSPEEWVDRLAESQGLSRKEVLEQLISSHWTLQEMLRLVEQTEGEMDEADGTVSPADRLDAGVQSEIEDEIADLASRLEAIEDRPVDIESLAERVDALEAAVSDDDHPSRADLHELDQRLSRVANSLGERHRSLRTRVDDEFGNLQTILEYLIDVTDVLDRRTESLSTSYQEEVDRMLAERNALVELKRRAARLGIETAECEFCSTAIDVAMLPTPYCPQCDRPFEDVVPNSSWWPFGSNVLTVAETADWSTDDDS